MEKISENLFESIDDQLFESENECLDHEGEILVEQGVSPCLVARNYFQEGDKVLCINDTPDWKPFKGSLLPQKVEKGKIYTVFEVNQYNCSGEVLSLYDRKSLEEKNECVGWHKSHFKLIKRYENVNT